MINKIGLTIFVAYSLYLPHQALAQTPSELAALSLQDLMGMSIDEDVISDDMDRWAVSYGYQRLKLDGYRTGRDNLSDNEVLRTGTATSKNYPILPTVITQEVHTINLSYKWNDNLQVGITAPYIIQSTDHNSIVSDFDFFTIKSEGIGDISVNMAYLLPIESSGNWKVLAAISLPTGSIKEEGDTPRNGEGTDEQLPYTMQLGSGTYDFPLSLQYTNNYNNINYGGQLNARLRTGKNSQGYRLGNTYGVNTWARWMTNSWVHPGVSIAYRHSGKIKGMDDSLTIPNPSFPFPANITDPDNFGADKVDLAFSVRVCSRASRCKQYIDLNMSKAVYQRLNGIQIKEDWLYGASVGMSF